MKSLDFSDDIVDQSFYKVTNIIDNFYNEQVRKIEKHIHDLDDWFRYYKQCQISPHVNFIIDQVIYEINGYIKMNIYI